MIKKGCLFIFLILLLIAGYTGYKIYKAIQPILYEKFKGVELLEPERKFKENISLLTKSKYKDTIDFYIDKIGRLSNEKKEIVYKTFNRTFNALKLEENLSDSKVQDLIILLRNLIRE
ncbi:MAG TPA: hypothetical protein PK887_07250 [Ignavibacteriales bacterium]|jgi:predicted site-specific integrase-resolvase|nr:hypothetical protein [Ignavibacteriales bacterium]